MARAAPYDRETALESALALFWDKGFHATSLKDLEKSLKMKPGSIYAAFSSKENLYLLALERYFNASRARLQDHVKASASPLGALADYLRSFATLAPDDKARQACMLTKTLVDTRNTEPSIAAATQGYLLEIQGEFAAVFRAAQNRKELPAHLDPNRLARRFQANITALRLALHQGMETVAFEELAEDMAREIEDLRLPEGG
ncbi:TetR/AcrR family transcriptional regulator [Neptunicoccus sediminis]|uniref:TetR/AcrR family transcriptional regulator n=1 Tax=Neptunicoccus sediminis TaxID=1892596 RepID=UPI000845C27C|nr:TetR/AcrR family transcriptional regulator [Neptunicoccus sediminis]